MADFENMADNRKFCAPSTSKRIEPQEEGFYDFESSVQSNLTKSGIKYDSTNKNKFVF